MADNQDASPDEARDLTSGSIPRRLFSMAGPMLIGLVSVMSMSLVDTYFVGQLGTLPLAAMGYSFPVIFFVGGISTGLGTATASVVSRAVGQGDESGARRVTTHALVLALALVLLLLAVGFPFLDPLFRGLGASDAAMPLIVDYMTIWLFGMVFFVTPVLGTSALRARGDAMTPMYLMIGGTLLNFVLDPLLIFGGGPVPALGIEGAALATAIARGLSTLATLGVLVVGDHLRTAIRGFFDGLWTSWRSLFRIGAPAAGTNVIVPVTTAILTRLTSVYGESAVAAYGAGSRIESMAVLVFFALSSGLGPIVGQNWGAGQRERVLDTVKLAGTVAILWGLVTWGLFAGGASWLADVFVDGPEAVDHLRLFLMVVPAGHAAQGVFLICNGALNAIDRPVHAAALSFTRTIVLTAPTAWIASHWFDVAGIFGSIAVANVIVGVAAVITTIRILIDEPVGS